MQKERDWGGGYCCTGGNKMKTEEGEELGVTTIRNQRG